MSADTRVDGAKAMGSGHEGYAIEEKVGRQGGCVVDEGGHEEIRGVLLAVYGAGNDVEDGLKYTPDPIMVRMPVVMRSLARQYSLKYRVRWEGWCHRMEQFIRDTSARCASTSTIQFALVST